MNLGIEEGPEGYRVVARFPDGSALHGEWETRAEAEKALAVWAEPLEVEGVVVSLAPGIWIGCARIRQGEELCDLPPVGPYPDEQAAQGALDHAVREASKLLGMDVEKLSEILNGPTA